MIAGQRTVIFGIVSMLAAACVPEGASTADAGVQKAPPPVLAPPRTKSSADSVAATILGPPIAAPFEDTFDRAELGPDWNALAPTKWHIVNGRLCGRGAHNRGVWLTSKLPLNARIEFDAIAESPEGDLKAELWGDGQSGATGNSYTNATSYLTILGGWKNTKHVLARLDEHGADRQEIDVDPQNDDERARPVEAGQPYRFKIERTDGKSLEWWVNGVSYFRLSDPDPLVGAGHDHLGFNDWEAPVCFDNIKITPL